MIRSFRRNLLSVFCFAIAFPIQAQITGNLNVKDPKALEITQTTIEMLCGKMWYPLQIHEIKRGEKQDRDNRGSIKFLSNGDLFAKDGKWEVINRQFIKIIRPSERKNSNFVLNGAYSIYQISDTALVFAQVLTSNGDWVREYTFTTSEEKYNQIHPKPNYSNYYRQPDKHPGENIKYYAAGNILSKEYYKLWKRKMLDTELFERSLPLKTDSSIELLIPTGNWAYYHPNGKIKSVIRHNDEGKMTGEIDYFHDGKMDRVYSDSYFDQYEYKSDGSLLHVKRTSGSKTIYVVGKQDSIGISRIEFFFRDWVRSQQSQSVQLYNLGKNEVLIKLKANETLSLKPKNIKIKPNDSLLLDLPIVIPQGGQENFLLLSTNEWNYKIKIHSFGFDLTTSDFESEKSFTLPSTFYFYLEPEGYQLEITPLSNPNKKKTIPISQQLTEIQLKKDKYHFTLYSPSGKRTISVEIK